jgi:subtilisin family serine protease
MKINSVKFKDRASFDKNKTKPNVVAVHEPFGIIVFKDEERVTPDHTKVSQVNEVDGSLDQIATGLAILVAPDLDAAIAYCKKNKVQITETFHLTNTLFVEVPVFAAFNEFYISLMNSKLFTSVEPDYIQPFDTNADAYTYSGQWHLPNMQAAEAWSLIDGAAYGEVAVLDIACDVDHEDLIGRISDTSWNCVTDAPDVRPVSDYERHGTPCSGLICAATDNSIGVSSLGNNKLKVQFLHIGYGSSSSGSFSTSDTIVTRAANKAIANPNCLAISMS